MTTAKTPPKKPVKVNPFPEGKGLYAFYSFLHPESAQAMAKFD